MSASELEDLQRQSGLVGEDAAVFSFEEQSLKSWGAFLAVLGTVLTALYYLWLNPDTGYGESESLPHRLIDTNFHGVVLSLSPYNKTVMSPLFPSLLSRV